MRKEIVNFILLVLLLSVAIISGVLISQYQAEIIRLERIISSDSQDFNDAQVEIWNLTNELQTQIEKTPEEVQIPITGNSIETDLLAQIEDYAKQVETLEKALKQRNMCETTIEDIRMSSPEAVNVAIKEFINENDYPVTGDSYWVTIWDLYYDITEHGFYGDEGRYWYYLVYQDSFDPGIYSVEEGCWIYTE